MDIRKAGGFLSPLPATSTFINKMLQRAIGVIATEIELTERRLSLVGGDPVDDPGPSPLSTRSEALEQQGSDSNEGFGKKARICATKHESTPEEPKQTIINLRGP